MKWLVIITIGIIVLNYLLIIITKEYRDAKLEGFMCKRCFKINRNRGDTCERCGAELKQWNGYKTIFLGRRQCLDGDEIYIKRSKVKMFARIDILIFWLISIVSASIAGWAISKLITFI
ncbi:MAG: hypothetical protein J6A59_14840 [Lachnospiraceae bacterium]|nr:hypothetical protein [Lachnospiraceae bacterium]